MGGMSHCKVSDNMEALIKLALEEDFGDGDVTSLYFVPAELQARALCAPAPRVYFPVWMWLVPYSRPWTPL